MMKLIPLFALASIISLSTACSKQKVSTLTNPNCTDSVFYSTQIKPMMDTYCLSCHGVGNSTSYTITTAGAPTTLTLASVAGAVTSTGSHGQLMSLSMKDAAGNATVLEPVASCTNFNK
jgi:hypothetical protein